VFFGVEHSVRCDTMNDPRNVTSSGSADLISSLDPWHKHKVAQKMEENARLTAGEIDSCLRDLAEWKTKQNTLTRSAYEKWEKRPLSEDEAYSTEEEQLQALEHNVGSEKILKELLAKGDQLAIATKEIETERKMTDSSILKKRHLHQSGEMSNNCTKYIDMQFDEHIAKMSIDLQCSEWMRESFTFQQTQSSLNQLELGSNATTSPTSCTV